MGQSMKQFVFSLKKEIHFERIGFISFPDIKERREMRL